MTTAMSSSALPEIFQVAQTAYQDYLPWASGLFLVSPAGLLSMLLFLRLGNIFPPCLYPNISLAWLTPATTSISLLWRTHVGLGVSHLRTLISLIMSSNDNVLCLCPFLDSKGL